MLGCVLPHIPPRVTTLSLCPWSGFDLFRVDTSGLPEGIARTTADQVLGVGERVFDTTAAMSYTSAYFERESKSSKK